MKCPICNADLVKKGKLFSCKTKVQYNGRRHNHYEEHYGLKIAMINDMEIIFDTECEYVQPSIEITGTQNKSDIEEFENMFQKLIEKQKKLAAFK